MFVVALSNIRQLTDERHGAQISIVVYLEALQELLWQAKAQKPKEGPS